MINLSESVNGLIVLSLGYRHQFSDSKEVVRFWCGRNCAFWPEKKIIMDSKFPTYFFRKLLQSFIVHLYSNVSLNASRRPLFKFLFNNTHLSGSQSFGIGVPENQKWDITPYYKLFLKINNLSTPSSFSRTITWMGWDVGQYFLRVRYDILF